MNLPNAVICDGALQPLTSALALLGGCTISSVGFNQKLLDHVIEQYYPTVQGKALTSMPTQN